MPIFAQLTLLPKSPAIKLSIPAVLFQPPLISKVVTAGLTIWLILFAPVKMLPKILALRFKSSVFPYNPEFAVIFAFAIIELLLVILLPIILA